MLDIITAVFVIGLAFYPLLRPDPMLRRRLKTSVSSARDTVIIYQVCLSCTDDGNGRTFIHYL